MLIFFFIIYHKVELNKQVSAQYEAKISHIFMTKFTINKY